MSEHTESRSLPAAGLHEGCELVAIGFAENEDTGTPYIFTEWQVEGVDFPRTVFTYLSDASFEKGMQKLESIGFNGDFGDPDCTVKVNDLICRHETWEGRVRDKWEFANWGGGIKHSDASKNTVRLMNQKYKKAAKPDASAAPAGKKPAPPAPKKKVAKTAPPVKSSQTPREDAWDAFVSKREDWEQAALVDGWDVLCTKVFPNKVEADFTAEDWAEIAEAAVVPF